MSIQNPYDHALKILARTYPEQFLQLGFPGQPVHLLGTLSNVELALEIDRVDFLHEIELHGERAYLHIDFQLEHDEDCRRRFFVYNGMLTELKKPTPVITLPVYLRPREKELPNSYIVKVGGLVFHNFSYPVIKLWEHIQKIRSGELYIFAPLLPVLTRPMSEAVLVEERQLILTYEADLVRQKTLLTTAILIAAQSQLFKADFLWDLFKGDTMDMDIENTVLVKFFDKYYGEKLSAAQLKQKQSIEQEYREKFQQFEEAAARREAAEAAARREAAEAAARREADAAAALQWQELMLKVLEHRFTAIPVALFLLIQAVPTEQRSRVSDLLLDAPDVEHCLQVLRQLQGAKAA